MNLLLQSGKHHINEAETMKACSIKGCPGHYESKLINHIITKDGQIIVIERVPASVCNICGDTLISLKTTRILEDMLEHPGDPVGTVPVYEMPRQKAA